MEKTKKKRLYNRWREMMRRCYEESSKDYKSYGGRGISVCERWHDVAMFSKDHQNMPDGMTLERIDNAGNYEPSNCRYASRKDQQQNTRRTVLLRIGQEMVSMAEAARRIGVDKSTIHYRLKKGQSISDLGLSLV